MKHFNFNQSLKNLVNNLKGLFILSLALTTFGVGNAWGADNTFGKAYSVPGIHAGGVYVTVNGNSPSSDADYKEYDQSGCYKATKLSIKANGKFMAKAWTGWEFSGWFSSSNCSGTAKSTSTTYEEKITGTETLTLYAKFTPITYKISYNGVPSGVSNPNPSTYNIESETITFSSLTRTGYTFSGWNPASIVKGSTGDKSTTASWTANKYNVTYDAQEGYIDGNSSKTIQETYDGYYACPIPTRDGYDFQGWYTATSGGSKVTTDTQVKITTAQTLYARWQVVNVDIKNAENKTVDFIKQTETLTTTLAFPVEKATSTSNFNYPSSSNTEWKVTDYSYSNNVVTVTLSFTATENVTTRGDHKSTITLTGKNGASAIGQVTAHVAMTPALTDNVPSNKLVGEASIDLNTLWTSTSNGVKTYTIKTWTPDGGAHNGGAVAPAINGSTLSLGQAGKLVLQLSQAAGTSSESITAEHTLTINRRDNNIFINGSKDSYQASIYMEAQQAINLTATNTDYAGSPITATQTAGNTIAELNAAQTQVTSNHNLGDATWSVSQPENYKYKAANASFTIHVVKQAEATDCYVLNDAAQYSASTGITDFEGVSIHTYAINGPCSHVWFDAYTTGTQGHYFIQYSIDNGSNYSDLANPNVSGSYKPFDYDLPENTTNIRFYAKRNSTLTHYVKNVRVSRKTYLTAADVTVDKNDNNNPVHPGEVGVNNLIINYSLANGGDLKVTWDNNLFTIDGHTSDEIINLGDKGCSTGTATLKIKYTSINPGTHEAHVVIYNSVYRTTMTITGKTVKRDQDVTWEEHSELMMRGQIAAPVSTTLGNVIYKSDDSSIIKVINDGTAIQAVSPGTTTISVFSAGNSEYNNVDESREITVTNQVLQFINWNQSLIGLKLGDSNVTLRASASQPDSLECVTDGRRSITYHSNDESIVQIVNNNQLKIVGIGTTTITATQAGGMDADGHDFIAVTAEKKVVVRDPNAPCETYIYTQGSEVKFDLGWNAASHQTKTHEIDFNGQEPGFVNFDYRGEAHKVLIDYYAGNLIIEQFVNGQWVVVKNLGTPTKNGSYGNTGNLELNRKATKISIKADNGMGYMYFRDCQVTLARYIEATQLNTFETKVGSPVSQTAKINYSNISNTVTLSLTANSNFTIDKTIIDGTCGDHGSEDVTITYKPTDAREEEQATLTISDGLTTKSILLIGTATVTPLHIAWNIPDMNFCYTVDQVTLNAQSLSDLDIAAGSIFYSLHANSTTGKINGNQLTFDKAGTAYVIANTVADSRYNPASSVTKSWTVSKTPTTITTKPAVSGDIVSGTSIASLILNGGAAQNTVNNQAVAGTFAVTAGDLVNIGQQTLTVTFTPNNTDMYESCTTTITVNVVKREATTEEVGTPSAASITYGNAINTSVLSGNGLLAGTWTWVDEDANKATPNVGTVDNLNVIFTPNDGNVKPVAATVSLTVTKADAQLDWTMAPADVEISEAVTYLATSNHSESTITYSITAGGEYATIDATTGVLTMLKAGTITVQAYQDATTNYNAATITTTTTITGQLENKFTNAAGDHDWKNEDNWTNGVPTEENPDVIIAGEVIIDEPISVGGLTIEVNGKVTVVDNGSLNVHGTSADRDTYGNLFIKNGGDVTIADTGDVRVNDFVIESSIGTNGTSQSGQITNADRVLYVNGAYIDINLDPTGKANDTQWYGFTVPFPVDVHNGVARKEGDTFRKLTYGTDYMFAEYDMNQRLNSGKGWKYITTSKLQPGRFYYITFDGDYNTYSFKAATNTITTSYTTDLTTNGTGTDADANWNAVGNSALRHVTASYGTTDDEKFVQVYQNGLSQYMTVRTNDATFVVGCPFFVQAKENTILKLTNAANDPRDNTYAPLRKVTKANRSIKMVIAPENGGYSDQVYMRTTTDVKSEYIIGRDLAKAGVGTASVQMWINAYGQKLSVNEVSIEGEEAIFPLGIYAPKAGGYRLTIDETDTPTYLMENGVVIWDFANGSYVVDLSKGTNNDYSIVRTAPNTPGEATDIYSAQQNNQSINKVIFRNKMYIINNAHTYDAQGQTIR